MLINIDNAKLELIKDLNASVDGLIMDEGHNDAAIKAHEQLRNICTTELLVQIKLIEDGNKRS